MFFKHDLSLSLLQRKKPTQFLIAFKIEKDNLEIVEWLFQCFLFHLKLILLITLKKLCRNILGYDRHPSCLSFPGPKTERLSVVPGFYLAVCHNPIQLALSNTSYPLCIFLRAHLTLSLEKLALDDPCGSLSTQVILGFCAYKETHVIQPHKVHSLGSSRGIFQEIYELVCRIYTDDEFEHRDN